MPKPTPFGPHVESIVLCNGFTHDPTHGFCLLGVFNAIVGHRPPFHWGPFGIFATFVNVGEVREFRVQIRMIDDDGRTIDEPFDEPIPCPLGTDRDCWSLPLSIPSVEFKRAGTYRVRLLADGVPLADKEMPVVARGVQG